MGIVVNQEDLGEEKVFVDGGRWGRPIETGKYRAKVIDGKDEYPKYGEPTTVGIKLVFLVTQATPEQIPEGPVRLDFEAYPNTSELTSLCRTFEPGVLKGEKAELLVEKYIGRECNILVNWNKKANQGKGRAYVNNLAPITGITDKPVVKAPEAAADPSLGF